MGWIVLQDTKVYCNIGRLLGWKIVLQYRGVQWKNCIAILVLYCDLKSLKGYFFFFFLYCNTHGVLWLRRDLGLRIVLQYNYYIAT